MRRLIPMTILAVTAFSSVPAQAEYQHCVRGYGCVPATERSYNACFNLAMKRGLNVSRGDRYNLDWFIYQCLEGKIPR